MQSTQDIEALQGKTLHDSDGDKIGEITDICLVREDGRPEWLGIKLGGLLGSKLRFVPLLGISADDDEIRAQYDKDLVKDAPEVEDHDELTDDEATRLYEHYSLSLQGEDGSESSADEHDQAEDNHDQADEAA